MSLMATRVVEPLDRFACQILVGAWTHDVGGIHAGGFMDALMATLERADPDNLDLLERAFPDLVHVVRVWKNDVGGSARIRQIARTADRRDMRTQCDECGWPMLSGYRPVPNEDDVEGWFKCTNPNCLNEY